MTEKTKPADKPKTKKDGARQGLTIRLVRSGICTPQDQKATIQGLGFHRVGQSVVREDTPAIRGMVRKVQHLLEVTKG